MFTNHTNHDDQLSNRYAMYCYYCEHGPEGEQDWIPVKPWSFEDYQRVNNDKLLCLLADMQSGTARLLRDCFSK